MIRCAVFDADGTIIDSLGVWRDADEEYLSSKGKVLTDGVYHAFMTMTYGESIGFVKKHYGLPDTEERISADIMKIVMKKYGEEVKAMPGIEEVLKHLRDRGVRMAVATANDRELVCRALHATGLLQYFSFVVTCDEEGTNKNSADVFVRAAERLGFGPSETLVVEDDTGYVKSARAAGFTALHVSEIRRYCFG